MPPAHGARVSASRRAGEQRKVRNGAAISKHAEGPSSFEPGHTCRLFLWGHQCLHANCKRHKVADARPHRRQHRVWPEEALGDRLLDREQDERRG